MKIIKNFLLSVILDERGISDGDFGMSVVLASIIFVQLVIIFPWLRDCILNTNYGIGVSTLIIAALTMMVYLVTRLPWLLLVKVTKRRGKQRF